MGEAKNTLKYFGRVSEKTPSTNQIWSFTPGLLTSEGWFSEKAPNLQELINGIRDGITAKKTLVLAVPSRESAAKTSDFRALVDPASKTSKIDSFRIRPLDGSTITENLFFIGVERKGPVLPGSPKLDPNAELAFWLVKLKVNRFETVPDIP